MIGSLLLSVLAPLLAGQLLIVGPEGPFSSIPAALAAATTGDTIEVRPGRYPGPLRIDRAVTLRGVGGPVLDGGGQGTVVTITASGATLRGFVIRGSGSDLNAEDAGVVVRAAGVTVEENRLEDILVGIALDDAPDGIVRANQIHGRYDLPPAARGDGLKLWYSPRALVEGNTIEQTRDCVIWYSSGLRLVNNTVEYGRYGLHFMYDDDAELINNRLRYNSVGAYLMYSRRITLRGNLLAGNRGPSGFGLGLKDVDDIRAEQNWLVDNRVGLWSDTSPTSLGATSRFIGNLFATNDSALALQPSTERNTFAGNSFRDNQQPISILGGGTLKGNSWSEAGRGNYWSDYRGFDADGDGIGDLPYRAESLAAELMDRLPVLRLFQIGPAAVALEFAARAFPVLQPTPKLIDPAPLLIPPALAPLPTPPTFASRPGPVAWFGWPAPALLLVATTLLLAIVTRRLASGNRPPIPLSGDEPGPAPRVAPASPPGAPTPVSPLEVTHLTRRFGHLLAVHDLSFSVAPGEVVALWGPNGAGKSTALKCVLGLLPYQGRVAVAGWETNRHGRQARRSLGYLPQEVALHDDLSVAETLSFYARLKGLSPTQALPYLEEFKLLDHRTKTVGALSGGLRQRLALSLALLGEPPFLILDEPLANLDTATRELVINRLSERRRHGTAMLLTSHRIDEVEALADRVLVLDQGRLAFWCAPTELADRLNLRVTLSLQIAHDRWEQALTLLRLAGLVADPNGRAIKVAVPPGDKVRPLRLLEGAGIVVTDFGLEDGTLQVNGQGEP